MILFEIRAKKFKLSSFHAKHISLPTVWVKSDWFLQLIITPWSGSIRQKRLSDKVSVDFRCTWKTFLVFNHTLLLQTWDWFHMQNPVRTWQNFLKPLWCCCRWVIAASPICFCLYLLRLQENIFVVSLLPHIFSSHLTEEDWKLKPTEKGVLKEQTHADRLLHIKVDKQEDMVLNSLSMTECQNKRPFSLESNATFTLPAAC